MYKLVFTTVYIIALFGCSNSILNQMSIDEPTSSVARTVHEERIIFIGDSITHGGLYHKNYVLYLVTRYPELRILPINAGISGDRLSGVLNRYDEDIAAHNPTTATIMLGMNDVGRWLYEQKPNSNNPSFESQQGQLRASYLAQMSQLIEKLQLAGAKVTLIKPSIYDDTAELALPAISGINDELLQYGKGLQILADKYQVSLVDVQRPMININRTLQSGEPSSSIVGQDRVHSGEQGHLVMTYALLNEKQQTKGVSNMTFSVAGEKYQGKEFCLNFQLITKTSSELEFDCRLTSLPMPLNDAQKSIIPALSPAFNVNQQHIRVEGLDEGTYQLFIDDKVIDKYTADDLSQGIDLANHFHTPMFQQAYLVKKLVDERWQAQIKLRDIAHVKYSMLDKYSGLDLNDITRVKQTLQTHVEKSKGKPWYPYLKGQISKYLEYREQQGAIKQSIEALSHHIYAVNKPQIHRWKLIKERSDET